jgi:hypothetical protein
MRLRSCGKGNLFLRVVAPRGGAAPVVDKRARDLRHLGQVAANSLRAASTVSEMWPASKNSGHMVRQAYHDGAERLASRGRWMLLHGPSTATPRGFLREADRPDGGQSGCGTLAAFVWNGPGTASRSRPTPQATRCPSISTKPSWTPNTWAIRSRESCETFAVPRSRRLITL